MGWDYYGMEYGTSPFYTLICMFYDREHHSSPYYSNGTIVGTLHMCQMVVTGEVSE